MRTPRNCLDRRAVLREPIQRLVIQSIPHVELVVVPAGSELIRCLIPLETADFLTMGFERLEVMFSHTGVTMEDGAVSRTGGEDVFVPGEGTDSGGVAGHGAELGAGFGVPDLDCSSLSTDGDCASLEANHSSAPHPAIYPPLPHTLFVHSNPVTSSGGEF